MLGRSCFALTTKEGKMPKVSAVMKGIPVGKIPQLTMADKFGMEELEPGTSRDITYARNSFKEVDRVCILSWAKHNKRKITTRTFPTTKGETVLRIWRIS
jgi:hypothetical protein